MATPKRDGMKKAVGFLKETGKQAKKKTASSELILKTIKKKSGK